MSDGTGLAGALLRMAGFRVLAVDDTPHELVVKVESTATVAWCTSCGVRAEAQDRTPRAVREPSCLGRSARVVSRSVGAVGVA